MTLADAIRRHGFRRWYERELLRGHAHLVLLLLSVLGLMMTLELGRNDGVGTLARLGDMAALVLCAAVGLWSLRRYLGRLRRAEAVAMQADCPSCGTYARFDVAEPADALGAPPRAAAAPAHAVPVRCRACGHGWSIDDSEPS